MNILRPRPVRAALVWLTVLAGLVLVAGVGAAGAASPSSGPQSPTSTTVPLDQTQQPITRIIPLPNSGHKPTSPGDQGGFLQVSLFFIICGAILLLGFLAFLDGRRKRRRAELSSQHAA